MDTDRDDGQAVESDHLSSANEDNFTPRFTPVRHLVLNKGATRVRRAKERAKPDELWHGDAFDPMNPGEASIPVYLRLGSPGALVAELVCGCMAHALGLPAPEVFLLTVYPGVLRRSSMVSKDAHTLCVATRDVGGDTFTQLLSDDDDAAVQLLHDWPDLNKVAAFDEWTANPDRNMGNLIYAAQTLHIIDHADAFGGQARRLYSLAELTEKMFSNKLADLLTFFDHNKRRALLNEIGTWISDHASNLNLQALVDHSDTSSWQDDSEDLELVDFLTQRLTVTHALLCNRLGHPQLNLQAAAP